MITFIGKFHLNIEKIEQMNKLFTLIILLSCTLSAVAQVSTSPATAIDDQSVTITFDATQGNAGLKDYTGDVYIHSGVITDQSTSASDWRYVISGWSENTETNKMTRIDANTYSITFSPSINDFYGVPAGEQVEQMAFVFRSADGSLTGKTSSGGDIFVDVSTNNITLSITSPEADAVYKQGDELTVAIEAANCTSVSLYINDVETSSVDGTTLNTTITVGEPGTYTLKAEATDGSAVLAKELQFYSRGDVTEETMPQDLLRGVNVIDEQSVTMVLYAPDKTFVHIIGEFNDWTPSDDYLMKKDGDYFWLTITGLKADTEYAFQFYIDGEIRVADPYTTKTLDVDDQYISADIYPNLKEYPSDKTSYVASVFTTTPTEYSWQNESFTKADNNKLVIYELWIRDFTEEGSIKAVTAKMDYFKELGVNAIELMPFNEFEGNESWGYNPSFYFATDKAYGTANDYKEFIDVCHQNGIAVIMDLVLNHSFSQSPFARMYLEDGKPAANNPWYNVDHNMKEPAAQWGYDFNHESAETQVLVDSICSYWINEFKVDGYRFDFTKGFTNTEYPVGDWASAYDASRIAILERMADEIWKRKSDAIIAFEHLADNSEEKVLANYGILLWGNHNYNFTEAVMGYTDNSDFSWASYAERGWNNPQIINYMESHDEERIMYKAELYGDSEGSYDITDINTALDRSKAAAAFLLTVPGPKMIWQFGELGYDYSINNCSDGTVSDDCRTSVKPVKWDYYDDAARKELFKVYAQLINLKKEEAVFASTDFTMDVSGVVKQISLNAEGSDIRLVGNFGMTAQTATPNFSSTGWWYGYFHGDSINVTDVNMEITLEAGDFEMYAPKKFAGFEDNVTSVESMLDAQISVYPNPTQGMLYIDGGDVMIQQLAIYTIAGEKVSSIQVGDRKYSVDLGSLPKGVYLLQLQLEGGFQSVRKFMKL